MIIYIQGTIYEGVNMLIKFTKGNWGFKSMRRGYRQITGNSNGRDIKGGAPTGELIPHTAAKLFTCSAPAILYSLN